MPGHLGANSDGSVEMNGKCKLDITTYRCTSCKLFEFYANPWAPANIDRLKSFGW
jgi:hypothetical protein